MTDQNAGLWEDVWADGEWTDDVACQAEFAALRVDAEAEAELAADRAIANAFRGFLCDV